MVHSPPSVDRGPIVESDSPAIFAAMTHAARSFASDRGDASLQGTLRHVTARAVQTLPGVDFASITIRHADGRLETVAATDERAEALDQKQYELGEGPCVEAVSDDGAAQSLHIAKGTRWPLYGPAADDAGVRCQLALQVLQRRHHSRGGLNLYSLGSGSFDTPDNAVDLFAAYASLVIGHALTIETLQGALSSREVIGQAIGITMERYNVSKDRAFEFLVRLSQDSNVKLRHVAEQLVGTASERNAGEGAPSSRVDQA